MKVILFTLCQAANIDIKNNLNILGAFDMITAIKVPVIYSCVLVLKLRFDKRDEGKKTFRISFIDADGKKLLPPLENEFVVSIPNESSFCCMNFISPIQKLQLDRFGNYSIDFSIDGTLVWSFELIVTEARKNIA
ncbi:MAG: hypothetical protein E3K37_18150 [Candidatus Kuenenia sp.]|nr:hypothetical protein [Candidatus Kuenenia hertensis]